MAWSLPAHESSVEVMTNNNCSASGAFAVKQPKRNLGGSRIIINIRRYVLSAVCLNSSGKEFA